MRGAGQIPFDGLRHGQSTDWQDSRRRSAIRVQPFRSGKAVAVRHPAAQSGGRANRPPTEWLSAEIVGADSRLASAATLLTRESRNIAAATVLALASGSDAVARA